MFGRRRTSSARSSLLMFHIDRPIARISSSLVFSGTHTVVLSLWRRDRNHMDSYQVSTVDVVESPISSSTRGPWRQQRCDALHCHEEWWTSVPPSVFAFSWVLDEGGDAGMCSSRQCLTSALEVQRGAVLTPSVSYATMTITFTEHCVELTFFGRWEPVCFH